MDYNSHNNKNTTLKVFFFISNFKPYGAQKIVLNLVKNLHHKINSIVIAFYNEGMLKDEFEKYSKAYTLNAKCIYDYSAIKEFYNIAKYEKPNVIYSFFPELAVIASIINTNRAYSLNNPINYEPLNQKIWHILAILATKNISGLSESCIASIPNFIKKTKNTTVIYPVIELKESYLTKEEAKEKFGVKGHFIFGNVARLAYQKGIDILLYAFSKLNLEAKLILVGSGDMEKYMKLAEKYKISNKVLFLGELKNPLDALKAMDVFVSTSRWEGLPLSIVEAMYNKLPIIAPNFLKASFKDNIVTFKTIPQLINKMEELYNNEALRHELSKKGRSYVEKAFDEAEAVNKYLKWIKAL